MIKAILVFLSATMPLFTNLENQSAGGKILGINSYREEVFEEINGPQKTTKSLGTKITAKSAIVIDRKSNKVLFEKEADTRLNVASLSKIMTAIVAEEARVDFSDEVTIDKEMIETEESLIDLEIGEKIRLSDLYLGMLVHSGNDATLALAKYIAGDLNKFVVQMNRKAEALGLFNTVFETPTGLEGNFSSARELSKLFDFALEKERFRKAISISEYKAHSLNSDKVHFFQNTNKLLNEAYPYVIGGKTGYTDEAGFCLATVASDKKGNEIISVVLGSSLYGDHFQDTKALIEWTFKNYKW